jgi:IS30 family transposase
MSPHYLYSVREVAAILEKAEDTIRKEARRIQAGTVKEGRYWFNTADVEQIRESFLGKRKTYLQRHDESGDNLLYALFARIAHCERLLKAHGDEHERFMKIFYEWFQQIESFRKEVLIQLKALRRAQKRMEG